MSEVSSRYSKGARTEPRGRPNGARAHGDRLVPNTTQLERPAKKDVIHSRGRPDSPKETERRLVTNHRTDNYVVQKAVCYQIICALRLNSKLVIISLRFRMKE